MEMWNIEFGSILELSKQISFYAGHNGELDSPEKAYKKLFEGDPTKKADDLGEAQEIMEELTKNPINKPGLASEIADFMYYLAKIPNLPNDKIQNFLADCGFSVNGAVRATEVKYEARVYMNKVGGDRETKHAYENGKLAEWLPAAIETGMVDFSQINVEKAKNELEEIKNTIYTSQGFFLGGS